MTTKADTTHWAGAGRGSLLREIVGIVLALLALLIFLSLLAEHYQTRINWIGPIGAWIAGKLFFAFGNTMAFALPFMIAVSAFHSLRGDSPLSLSGRSWLRGLGGLMIMVASCALLALKGLHETIGLPALPLDEAIGGDPRRAFAMGGMVGNILISGEGANIARLLGPLGATLVLSAMSLVGLVLFTETLLRDLVRLGWRGLRALAALAARVRWLGALRVLGVLNPLAWLPRPTWLLRPLLALRRLRLPVRFVSLFRGLHFQRDGGRVMPVGPIIEIAPAPQRRRLEEGEAAGKALVPRSGRIMGGRRRAAAEEEAGGVAMEVPPPPMDLGSSQTVLAGQAELDLFPQTYQLPSLGLLTDPPPTAYTMSEDEQQRLSRKIEQTLEQFKTTVEVIEVIQGPVITRFALKVAPGVRVNRILALESELAMALKAQHVRILAPIPGQSAVGIEVPNKRANPVMLKELLATEEFRTHKSNLAFALGRNIAGEPVICDLAQMPHLLIAGATGSGKSVCLNAIIASLLYRNPPDKVKFAMIDPKRVELSIYQAIPHLIAPVVCDTRKAAAALAWCVEQMEQRYKTLAEFGVRNSEAYNAMATGKMPLGRRALGQRMPYMPHIVIIIDELADLMMVAKAEIEEYVIRLAQMARAVGMHLVLATQRPSVNVITGLIKANFPSRIAFQVSAKVDSRTILDLNGAETLLGRGDMLYSPGGAKPFRIQGCYVSDSEVERLADFIRDQEKARYEKEDFETRPTPAERAKAQVREDGEDEVEGLDFSGEDGPGRLATAGRAGSAPLTPADMESMSDEMLYDMALRLILESRKASVSYIQRRMKIGYARAGRIMDLMEERGIVGPYQGSKPRDLIVDAEEYLREMDE